MAFSIACPLCSQPNYYQVEIPRFRSGYSCSQCHLLYVDSKHFLTPEQEEEYYGLHENSIENKNYVSFLNQAIEPVLSLLDTGMQGLDFGCGPGPTLSKILALQGIECEDYDPFFFPKKNLGTYDFIFATECFEHFHKPAEVIDFIDSLLKPRALLIVMTDPVPNDKPLEKWGYAHDPTHVSFYSEKTMKFIAENWNWELLTLGNYRVFVFRKLG